jgi:hypothetical protein
MHRENVLSPHNIKILSTALLIAAFIAGCAENTATTEPAASSPTIDSNTVSTPDSKSRAIDAKDSLAEKLSMRLMQAMSNGGPAAAIEVCSKDAPRLAAEVGKEHGVQIGRTSFKLRNPKNAPPEWAADRIESRSAEPQFVDLPDGDFGALLPIKIQPQCMTCHGPADQIDEAVKIALAELYPSDQATGFEIDDLRGWFWVSVPVGL